MSWVGIGAGEDEEAAIGDVWAGAFFVIDSADFDFVLEGTGLDGELRDEAG